MKKTIKLNAIQRIVIIAIAAVIGLAFTACEGPEGPTGPQGPAGGVNPDTCEHLFKTGGAVTTQPTETTDGVMQKKCIECFSLLEPITVPAWNKYYGTWVSGVYTIVIDKDNFKINNTNGNYLYFSISNWGSRILENTNTVYKDSIPVIIHLAGSVTSSQNYSDTTTVSIALNVNGNLGHATSAGSSFNSADFIKQ
jgi:hypothetical protein